MPIQLEALQCNAGSNALQLLAELMEDEEKTTEEEVADTRNAYRMDARRLSDTLAKERDRQVAKLRLRMTLNRELLEKHQKEAQAKIALHQSGSKRAIAEIRREASERLVRLHSDSH